MNYKDLFQFQIGQMVFLKTDIDQHMRMVTGICIRGTGVQYALSFGSAETWHYEFEVTSEIDIFIKTNS